MTTTTNLQHQHDNDSRKTGACCQEIHDEIACVAHSTFIQHGSHDGHDVQNWLDAETHVKAKHANERHAHHEHHHATSASPR